jgi:hypothetical protein
MRQVESAALDLRMPMRQVFIDGSAAMTFHNRHRYRRDCCSRKLLLQLDYRSAARKNKALSFSPRRLLETRKGNEEP